MSGMQSYATILHMEEHIAISFIPMEGNPRIGLRDTQLKKFLPLGKKIF